MKKILSIVLAVALCLTAMVGCFTVSADGAATATVDTVSVDAGTAEAVVNITIAGDAIAATYIDVALADELVLAGVASATDGLNAMHNSVNAEGVEDFSVANAANAIRILLDSAEGVVDYSELKVALTFNTADMAAGEYAVTVTDSDAADSSETAVVVSPVAGAVVVEDAEDVVYEDANLKLRGAAVTVANGFAIDFKVKKTMETDLGYSDIYVEFAKPRFDAEGNVTETIASVVTADQRTDDASNSENYLYTLDGIQPQELGTTVTATIYGYMDGKLYKGATVEYSVLKFATNQLKNTANAATLLTACADMIMYGAAVQDYASYNTANPIVDAADALCGSSDWQSYATDEITRTLVNAQTNAALDGATVRIRSAGVTLSSKVILYFNCADLSPATTLTDKDNYVVRVSYVDSTGATKTYDLAINDNYQAELDTLYSTELGTVVTATMIDVATDTAVSNTVTYSIETFLSKNISQAWCTALCKYGDSVRAFAGLS